MIDILTSICNKIWKTGEWPTTWTQSLLITLPEKGNLQLCRNYRTISLITHPSNVMLKIILNRLQPQAERASWFKSRKEHHRTNIYFQDTMREIPDTKPYGQLWGNTTSMPTSYESLKICITRPKVQSCSMAAQETGSELQKESDNIVYSHQPSLTSS